MVKRRKGGQPGNVNAVKWSEEDALRIGEDLLEWMERKEQNIFLGTFLRSQGLYRDIVRKLSDRFPSFGDLIKKAKEIQEDKLAFYALTKNINTAMAIFLLKNNHGYKDRQEHSHDVNIPSSITYEHVSSKPANEDPSK